MRVSNVLGLFKAQKTSEAYNLFAKQGPILQDILEHEGTPQEIAQGNSCFLYCFSPSMMYQLVDCITKEPEVVSKETSKQAFVASLFFCLEQTKLLNNFFKDENLLMYFLDFLMYDHELNSTLSGYFAKACDVLMSLNPENFLSILFENSFESGLFRHLYTSSISDVLIKVLALSGELTQFLPNFVILANNCMEMMRCQDIFVTILASQVMQKVINLNFDRLHAVYLSKSFLTDLLKGIQHSEDFIVNGKLKVLSVILTKNAFRPDLMLESVLMILVPVLETTLIKLESFSETFLVVLEVLRFACAGNHDECSLRVKESKLLGKVLELFEKYPWSTILHNAALALFKTIFNENSFLTEYLVKEVKVQEFIVRHALHPMTVKGTKNVRIGFLPHLFVMANDINRKARDNLDLTEALESTSGWNEFISNTLNTYNILQNKQLGYCDNKFLQNKNLEDLNSDETLKNFENLQENNEKKQKSPKKDEVFTENNEEKNNLKNAETGETKKCLLFKDEDKENAVNSEKLLNLSNSIVEKILAETLLDLVSLSTTKEPITDQDFSYTYVNFWKIIHPAQDLEEL